MSNNFLSPLVVDYIDGRSWRVAESFEYVATIAGYSFTIHIPVGFITDFASIPRILWTLLPPTGRYGKAAVIHDFLYNQANAKIPGTSITIIKEMADRVFLEAMAELNVPIYQRYAMYQAVRIFGRGNFGNYGR